MEDITFRAKRILSEVDIIAAEDTRRMMILLNKLGIHANLISNHKYNEYAKIHYFIKQLESGKDIAIVTDAGTPCISDPGNALVKEAAKKEINIVGVPGSCAAINGLVVSGFDLSSFLFCGFFPRDNGDRIKHIKNMRRSTQTRTFVYYESPKRIMGTIQFFISNDVECLVCLSNDMTKRHEMIFRGTPADVKKQLEEKGNYAKGEFVIVIELRKEYMITKKEHTLSPEAVLIDMIVKKNCSIKDSIAFVMQDDLNTFSKNELYSAGLRLKELLS